PMRRKEAVSLLVVGRNDDVLRARDADEVLLTPRVLLHDRHGARGPPELGYRPGRPWTLGAPFGAAVLRGPSALRPVGTHRCAVRTAERRRPGDGARQARPFGAVEVAAAGR